MRKCSGWEGPILLVFSYVQQVQGYGKWGSFHFSCLPLQENTMTRFFNTPAGRPRRVLNNTEGTECTASRRFDNSCLPESFSSSSCPFLVCLLSLSLGLSPASAKILSPFPVCKRSKSDRGEGKAGGQSKRQVPPTILPRSPAPALVTRLFVPPSLFPPVFVEFLSTVVGQSSLASM